MFIFSFNLYIQCEAVKEKSGILPIANSELEYMNMPDPESNMGGF